MRVDNPDARKYYITEAANQNWGTRQLDRNIGTFYYERLLSTKTKKEALLKQQDMEKASPRDIIKDPYVLEFLDIIILCAEKDQALVKYSVLAENKQIFASKYKLILPTPEELKAELEREIHFLKKKVEEKAQP
jgi:hypothetical protein